MASKVYRVPIEDVIDNIGESYWDDLFEVALNMAEVDFGCTANAAMSYDREKSVFVVKDDNEES
jgi:hypothetical protein